ncbi:hypothetical protein K239x_06300 [Planctomycetes bacterium K23_9]|uniref:Uncharacterized protein n=1 Tax=Stieleria marina TaxID=1930275 RepID=A0A517NNH9_9BACT|nr:hypothetical protein K239x_06300 [Planctomycetes bacterium K23_9]
MGGGERLLPGKCSSAESHGVLDRLSAEWEAGFKVERMTRLGSQTLADWLWHS